MKKSLRLIARAPAVLGLILGSFALAACSGSVFDGGYGDASVGGVAAAGGQSNGGANSEGGNQGVGGSAGSPSNTGGAPSSCTVASDCIDCAYNKAPANSSQCYCAICASTPMSTTQCYANRSAWQNYCANVPMACPAIACLLPPPPACVNGVCVPSSSGTTN